MFTSLAKSSWINSAKTASNTQFIRFQSTKPTNLNLFKTSVATKAAKNKSIKNEYNAISNQNLVTESEQKPTISPNTPLQQSKVLKSSLSPSTTRTKKQYKCPKVPNTSYLDPEYLAIDALYAGYRPLAMKELKKNLVPLRSLYRRDSCWSSSATGIESFPEWDELEFKNLGSLFPLRPPTSNEVYRKSYKDDEKSSKSEKLVYGSLEASNTPSKTEHPVQPKLKNRRGRVRPSAVRLLHKKKK